MQHAETVLETANMAKYHQNQSAKETLLATGQKTLGEASSNMLYGTGVGLLDNNPNDCSKWTGKNLMGKILAKVRVSLQ